MKKNNPFFSFLIAIFLFSFTPNSVYGSCERDSTEHDFFITHILENVKEGYSGDYICVNIIISNYKCLPSFFTISQYRDYICFGDNDFLGDTYCDSIFSTHVTRLLEKDTLYMSARDYIYGQYWGAIDSVGLDNCFNGLTLLDVVKLYLSEEGYFKTNVSDSEQLTVLYYLYKNNFFIGKNQQTRDWRVTDMFCKTNYLPTNSFYKKKYCK